MKLQVNTKYEDYVKELFKDFVKLFGVDNPTQTGFRIMYSLTHHPYCEMSSQPLSNSDKIKGWDSTQPGPTPPDGCTD